MIKDNVSTIITHKYYCECCNYYTSNKTDYNKHLSTLKHINIEKYKNKEFNVSIIKNDKLDDDAITSRTYKCDCGKLYPYQASLYNHKKKCNYREKKQDNDKEKDKEKDNEKDKEKDNELYKEKDNELYKEKDKELDKEKEKDKERDYDEKDNKIFKLLEENKDIKEFLLTQQQQMMKIMENQQQQISDILPKIGNNNNNNNTNNINNTTKNKFNLKKFLNETCKNAITMTEFIDRFEISMKNILLLKDKGLVESVTQAFIENMNKLSITERPIHCTDKKRERLYIKNETWELDEDNKQIKIILKRLNHKQLQSTELWTDANPDFMTEDSLQDEFVKLIGNCTTSFEGKDDKIIRNICEHIYLSQK